MKKFSKVTAREVLENFQSDSEYGLSNAAISSLKKIHGTNKIAEEEKEHILLRYVEHFKDPLILLLLGSAVLSILVGQYEDAFSIAAAVVIVGSVAFYQEYKSEESLEALNNLVPPTCNVLRNGNLINILAEEVVPGDILRLHAGDRVAADARIVQCSSFSIDESALTGEVEPREKTTDPLPDLPDNAELTEYHNIIFMGTLVCSGHATCVVVATGLETEFGKTSQEMKDIESRRSPLQTKMDDLGKRLSILSMGIIVIIGIIGILKGKSFLAMFNIGVSLAVAAIPEGLPICVTVTLALGVMRMAKKNAIIKKLPAVEALGCANFICTDKTGTLTENKMTVMKAFCPVLEDALQFYYGDNKTIDLLRRTESGKYTTATTSSIIASQSSGMSSSSKNSHNTSIFELRYNGNPVDPGRFTSLQSLFDAACLCNNAVITNPSINAFTGQPTEGALLFAAQRLGLPDRRNRLKRVKEVNFSSETKYMEVTYTNSDEGSDSIGSQTPRGSQKEVNYLKGALEVILPQCVTYLGGNGELLLLSSLVIERIQSQSEEMAREGLRVIAVAYGTKQNQLTFCGIIGLMDPLRFGVIEAVHRIQDSGAKVMMITGDAETTAKAIGQLAGIYDPVSSKILSGKEIEEFMKTGEDALASIISDVSICYRTSPRHKLFILSTSIAALSLVALNNLVGRPNPLNPMQILWINIIMDGPLAQSLGVEIVDPSIMRRPPRKRHDDIITKPLLYRVITSGILILIGTMYVFIHEMEDGEISSRDLTMTFTTFVMFDMFNAYACRHNSRSFFEIHWNSNHAFLVAATFSLTGQALVVYFPPLQKVFRTVTLSFMDIFFVVILASTMLLLDYIRKRYFSDIFTEKVATLTNSGGGSNSSMNGKKKDNAAFLV
eukprot:gene12300-13453_t